MTKLYCNNNLFIKTNDLITQLFNNEWYKCALLATDKLILSYD